MATYNGGTAKSLSGKRINSIVAIIDNWQSPTFTWEALVNAIEIELMIEVTRQTLSSYSQIKAAYNKKKKNTRLKKLGVDIENDHIRSEKICINCIKIQQKIEKLTKEIEQLEKTNESQLGQIISMIHQLRRYYPNVDLEEIMKPIEEVNSN